MSKGASTLCDSITLVTQLSGEWNLPGAAKWNLESFFPGKSWKKNFKWFYLAAARLILFTWKGGMEVVLIYVQYLREYDERLVFFVFLYPIIEELRTSTRLWNSRHNLIEREFFQNYCTHDNLSSDRFPNEYLVIFLNIWWLSVGLSVTVMLCVSTGVAPCT